MKKTFLAVMGLAFVFSPGVVLALTTGAQRQINPSAWWNQSYSSIACSTKEDKCLIVWRDKRNDPGNENDGPDHGGYYGANSNADIYGQMISSDSLLGPDFVIASDAPTAPVKVDQATPGVVYNPEKDEFFVAWHEADPAATDRANNNNFCIQGGYDIYGQRVSSGKQLVGGKITISRAADCQWRAILAYDSRQSVYFVAWHDFRFRGVDGEGSGRKCMASL